MLIYVVQNPLITLSCAVEAGFFFPHLGCVNLCPAPPCGGRRRRKYLGLCGQISCSGFQAEYKTSFQCTPDVFLPLSPFDLFFWFKMLKAKTRGHSTLTRKQTGILLLTSVLSFLHHSGGPFCFWQNIWGSDDQMKLKVSFFHLWNEQVQINRLSFFFFLSSTTEISKTIWFVCACVCASSQWLVDCKIYLLNASWGFLTKIQVFH